MKNLFSIRTSFRSKLLVALLGTVGLLLGITLLVVQMEISGQVEEVSVRAVERSRSAYGELEALERARLEQLGSAFTDSRRTLALLEAALDDGDWEYLIQQTRYEQSLRGIEEGLTVFTDDHGAPVVTLLGDRELVGEDPVGVSGLAMPLMEEGQGNLTVYRLVEGRLFLARVLVLELAGRPIGTVTLGLPVNDDTAVRLGSVIGAEVCFVTGASCVAGTPMAREELRAAMEAAVSWTGIAEAIVVAGQRWSLVADPISGSGSDENWWVLAVPLDPVLAPFARIVRALAVSGLVALILAVGVSLALSRSLSGPVRALVRATEKVAKGDYETTVTIRSKDELGALGDSFNEMTKGLLLKERYRGVLNKVVSRDVADELMQGELVLGGETREVSVLFADIVGFTPLTEGMEPQGVIGLLNECMQRLGDVVEEEGGVVDKYVGDEVMAVFGAPLSHEQDALSAVRAGVRMQEAIGELNRDRNARGEKPIRIRVGISTGMAVAGNMGSPNRLNYTVLGESVNLAARLCAAADPDDVFVSEATYGMVSDQVEAEEMGDYELKGFSSSVSVFGVRAIRGEGKGGSDSGGGGTRRLSSILLAALLSAQAALGALAPLSAQTGRSLPTLRDLGLSYMSPSGVFQVDMTGRLDLEGYVPQDSAAWIIPSTDPFLAGRLRLFTDIFYGERLYGLVELRADRGEEPAAGDYEARVEQAFVRVQPIPSRSLYVQVGRFASAFAGYAQRHHTVADPLIRPPLMYDHRTMICPTVAPSSAERFLAWRDFPHLFRPTGAPVIWGAPYQWGAMVFGSVGPVSARIAGMNSAPSSEPEEWGLRGSKLREMHLVANLGYQVSPELRVEASYDRGPYLIPEVSGALPAGTEYDDYLQEIVGVEVVYARGGVTLRGEGFADRWEVPNVADDAWDYSYYLEGAVDVAAGLFTTLRYSAIRFSRITAAVAPLPGGSSYGAGSGQRWDYNVARWQAGLGYRIALNTGIRLEYAFNGMDGPIDPRNNLLSLQWWWEM